MANLCQVQVDMLAALFERSDAAAAHVLGHGLPPERRLDIYRNNLFGSLTQSLSAVYPTVAQLVGDGFFRFMAHQYILAHPSRSGNLHEFGGELATFLDQFEPARSLPYLADSARLDWAWHVVFHTASTPRVDLGDVLVRMATMSDDDRAALRLGWQPAARLVASPFPVLRIWQMHQSPLHEDGSDAPLVDLDTGGEAVLVIQRAGEILLVGLRSGEYALLEGLSTGARLGDAVASSLEVDGSFDVAVAIAHHLSLGTLTGLNGPPAA
jgi:hypothetical protein